MQIGDGALRMGGCLENRALVGAEDFGPGLDIGSVVGARLQFRHDPEVGAKHCSTKFDQHLFKGALAPILVIARKIPVQPVRRRSPMQVMPISA